MIRLSPSNLAACQTELKNIYKNIKYPAFNKARFKGPWIKKKLSGMQGNSIHNEEINQPVESNPELTQLLESTDKNFKTIIVILFVCSKI